MVIYRHTRGMTRVVVGLVPLALLLVVWEVLGKERDPRFPRPSSWIAAIARLQEREVLGPALASTTLSFLAALVISLLAGAGLGVLVGSVPPAARALGPLLEILRVTPAAAIVPIAVLLIGTTSMTTIAVVVFAAIWPILLNTAAAVHSLPAIRVDIARSLTLSRVETFGKVILPSLVPGIALGVRVATPICLVVVLVAEMLASTGGVGQLLIERQHAYDASSVFGLLVIIGVLGLIINVLIAVAEGAVSKNFANARR